MMLLYSKSFFVLNFCSKQIYKFFYVKATCILNVGIMSPINICHLRIWTVSDIYKEKEKPKPKFKDH